MIAVSIFSVAGSIRGRVGTDGELTAAGWWVGELSEQQLRGVVGTTPGASVVAALLVSRLTSCVLISTGAESCVRYL